MNYRRWIPRPVKKSIQTLRNRVLPDSPLAGGNIRTIAVCAAQVPFARGGAEEMVDGLVRELQARGYLAEVVQLPFKWYPQQQLLKSIQAWQLLDLREADGQKIDLVITTKFPSYFVAHPHKVLWLIHQYRQIYDLYPSAISNFDPQSRADRKLRQRIIAMDSQAIKQHRRIFTISQNTANRLFLYNNIRATPLYQPPKLAGKYYHTRYGDYVLSVGRLEKLKRVDLLVRAMAFCSAAIHCKIVGSGPELEPLRELAQQCGSAQRIEFLGRVSDEELLTLYAGCAAVFFAPQDEDYGFVTLEAFLAKKPLITAADSGGTLEFVEHEKNGLVLAQSEPQAIAAAIERLLANKEQCRILGEAGWQRASAISWDNVIAALLGEKG